MKSPKDLRELRLWHWRKVMSFREAANLQWKEARERKEKHPDHEPRYMNSRARQNDRRADWHLNVVVMLNDFVDGTAEDDNKDRRYEQI